MLTKTRYFKRNPALKGSVLGELERRTGNLLRVWALNVMEVYLDGSEEGQEMVEQELEELRLEIQEINQHGGQESDEGEDTNVGGGEEGEGGEEGVQATRKEMHEQADLGEDGEAHNNTDVDNSAQSDLCGEGNTETQEDLGPSIESVEKQKDVDRRDGSDEGRAGGGAKGSMSNEMVHPTAVDKPQTDESLGHDEIDEEPPFRPVASPALEGLPGGSSLLESIDSGHPEGATLLGSELLASAVEYLGTEEVGSDEVSTINCVKSNLQRRF